MKPLTFLAIISVAALSACSSKNLPGSVRSVSVAAGASQTPMVLAPAGADYFNRMANEHSTWVVNALRASIQRELANGGRFAPAPNGSGDALITIGTLRHGLIEVSANNYAVQVAGDATITQAGKQIATRDFSGVSGIIKPLTEFEDSKVYEEAMQGVVDKVALEMTTTL